MSHAIKFECVEHIWLGGVLIFDDGTAKLHRHRLHPDRPVLVQVEGKVPTFEQIQMCKHLWSKLYEALDFSVASFCPVLLPYSSEILGHSKIDGAA